MTVKDRAIQTLTEYFAYVIRVDIGDSPDHSGPEDVAVELAEELVEVGYDRLMQGDWKDGRV